MSIRIPNEREWGNYSVDFDVKDAFDMFCGVDNEGAKKLLHQDVTLRTTDIRFMPEKPFQFYLRSFCEFILDNKFDRLYSPNTTSASAFLDLVEEKLGANPEWMVPITEDVEAALDFIADDPQFTNNDAIYGSFSERVKLIKSKIRSVLE